MQDMMSRKSDFQGVRVFEPSRIKLTLEEMVDDLLYSPEFPEDIAEFVEGFLQDRHTLVEIEGLLRAAIANGEAVLLYKCPRKSLAEGALDA